MQAVCDIEQATASDKDASAARLEQVQRLVAEFGERTRGIQKLLTALCMKITAPAV